ADTVIVLDFALWRCAWQAAGRSRENLVFWRWLIFYRRRSLPTVMAAIAANARDADVYVLRKPRDVRRFLAQVN
ncbi:MAG: adenylate kinase, partial [Mycobacterium sp.]|nr:adenylate kinase [Mycobacterium sp.]